MRLQTLHLHDSVGGFFCSEVPGSEVVTIYSASCHVILSCNINEEWAGAGMF